MEVYRLSLGPFLVSSPLVLWLLLLLLPMPHLSFTEFRPNGRWWALDIPTQSQIHADSTDVIPCPSGPSIVDQRNQWDLAGNEDSTAPDSHSHCHKDLSSRTLSEGRRAVCSGGGRSDRQRLHNTGHSWEASGEGPHTQALRSTTDTELIKGYFKPSYRTGGNNIRHE